MSKRKNFFVILYMQKNNYTHMSEGEDNDIAWFETEAEAVDAAKGHPLGHAFGYDVFEIGNGN